MSRGPSIRDPIQRQGFGEELLILTPPMFAEAANRLAAWKNSKGISTIASIVNDGSGPGPDTAEEIDKFIEDQYDSCLVRPSYVLLIGDTMFVPTFYPPARQPSITSAETIGSDYQYSIYPHLIFDFFIPFFAVGRIPVATLDEANAVVDKIIGYGKLYLLSQIEVADVGVDLDNTIDELHLWHLLGDPTLEIWTARPIPLFEKATSVMENGFITVKSSDEGAAITALQPLATGNVPVGRAMVRKGEAKIPILNPPMPGVPVTLSASRPNAVAAVLAP